MFINCQLSIATPTTRHFSAIIRAVKVSKPIEIPKKLSKTIKVGAANVNITMQYVQSTSIATLKHLVLLSCSMEQLYFASYLITTNRKPCLFMQRSTN